MKYCRICKSIFKDSDERCPECGKKLFPITDVNEPVRLCIVGGTERAMLCGLLDDAKIPYLENNTYPQGLANEIVTGYDVKLSNINLTVPFSALPEAIELLSSIETVKNPVEPMLDDINAHIEHLQSGSADLEKEEKRMSPALRTTIKVVTAILFLLLIAVVVLGTDKIMELIKGLFGG